MKRFISFAILLLINLACTQSKVVEVTRIAGTTAVSPTLVPSSPPPISTPMDLLQRPADVVSTLTPKPIIAPLEKVLTICQAQEPNSLFLYDSSMLAADHVRHAIYENLITNLDFSYQPQGIEKLPSLADGDGAIEPVEVNHGDWVVDADNNVVQLAAGVILIDANGQRIMADGSSITMSQLSATFTLKPLIWSDGTAVSAADSVFSFEVNQATNSFRNMEKIARTAVYEATGDLTLRWVGLPGFLDQTYFLNVWSPLPRHELAQYEPDVLSGLAEVRERPLATGPFVVASWESGQQINLTRNPHYYLADEGFPRVDRVIFKFFPNSDELIANTLNGNCYIATQDSTNMGQIPFLREAAANGLLRLHITSGRVWEHIDFGINSAGAYGDGNGRPDWFEDVRVRQAMMMCTNRQQMVDELLYSAADIAHAYLPDTHPLMPDDLRRWPYDAAAANTLLNEAGLIDTDSDGFRNTADGTPFIITLHTTLGAELRPAVSQIFAQNMRDCRIEVAERLIPGSEMFAAGLEGPIFGRRFDLALFAWLAGTEPACSLWHSDSITGDQVDGFGGWTGSGNTGWRSEAFDTACGSARVALPGTAVYATTHQDALRIFAEELPVMPLFFRLRVGATRPEVLNFHLDSSENSELWNLYEVDFEE
jgi:peptide/nickel transport system substrate-binding protein